MRALTRARFIYIYISMFNCPVCGYFGFHNTYGCYKCGFVLSINTVRKLFQAQRNAEIVVKSNYEDFLMATEGKNRNLTDKEKQMLCAAIDVRVSQLKRANNVEENVEIRKIREVAISDYATLRANVVSSGVQMVIP